MSHLHEMKDDNMHFLLDEDLNITCKGKVRGLKCGDHAAEIYSFMMPRYYEGHDMSLCEKVEVHYTNIHFNIGTGENTQNKSFDKVQDFNVCEDNENKITFKWLVQGDATQLDGTLNFCIRFACMNGEIIEYQKFSEIYKGVPVGKSICNTEEVAMLYADVLAAWKLELEEGIKNAGKVKSVNGVEPDEAGNIEIDMPNPPTDEEAFFVFIETDLFDVATDVNGEIFTDTNGNVIVF